MSDADAAFAGLAKNGPAQLYAKAYHEGVKEGLAELDHVAIRESAVMSAASLVGDVLKAGFIAGSQTDPETGITGLDPEFLARTVILVAEPLTTWILNGDKAHETV